MMGSRHDERRHERLAATARGTGHTGGGGFRAACQVLDELTRQGLPYLDARHRVELRITDILDAPDDDARDIVRAILCRCTDELPLDCDFDLVGDERDEIDVEVRVYELARGARRATAVGRLR